jgi:hypothetical protein
LCSPELAYRNVRCFGGGERWGNRRIVGLQIGVST